MPTLYFLDIPQDDGGRKREWFAHKKEREERIAFLTADGEFATSELGIDGIWLPSLKRDDVVYLLNEYGQDPPEQETLPNAAETPMLVGHR